MATRKHTTSELRRHIISLGNNGKLMETGRFGTTAGDLRTSVQRLLDDTRSWDARRIMLFAHGGVVSEADAVSWVDNHLDFFMRQQIYPLCFVWHSDPWTTITDTLHDELTRRTSAEKGLNIFDTVNRWVERAIRNFEPVRTATWLKMKDKAIDATLQLDGGARLLARELSEQKAQGQLMEIHLAGHSAGGVFHAPLTQLLSANGPVQTGLAKGELGLGLPIESVTLWAPGCTTAVFKDCYAPAINSGAVKRFSLFTLTDKLEQDDAVPQLAYTQSILYLVSNGFEGQADTPILGMEKFVEADAEVNGIFDGDTKRWIHAKSALSQSQNHTGFGDDPDTLKTTVRLIKNDISSAR